MRGDRGPGLRVRVEAEENRLRLVSGSEVVGDWRVPDIGIKVLHDGFNIRAEGEEFILHTADDVSLAEELGVAAASPRLARLLAVRHNPEERAPLEEPEPARSNLGAIGLALAGGLLVFGATILNNEGSSTAPRMAAEPDGGGFEFWLAFLIGGVLLIGTAYVMSIGVRVARLVATGLLVVLMVLFGFLVTSSDTDPTQLTAYGFIAGGLVLGVAVLVSGSLRSPD